MKYLIILLLLFQTACSTLPTHKPIAPKVEVSDVEVIEFGLSSQLLGISLDVFNPNSYDLSVSTLEFTVFSDEQEFASGQSNEYFLLPAKANTPVTVNVKARANRVLRKLLASFLDEQQQLDYTIKGFVKLDNWPARIPFDVDQTLSLDDS